MVSKKSRAEVRIKKHNRMRNRFSGTAERPRLSVFRSNNHMYAQIIDDTVGNTLVSASTLEKDVKSHLLEGVSLLHPGKELRDGTPCKELLRRRVKGKYHALKAILFLFQDDIQKLLVAQMYSVKFADGNGTLAFYMKFCCS